MPAKLIDQDVPGPDTRATAAAENAAARGHEAALRQTRLLDSVAEFTYHRDIDALDHSLVLSLAELVRARSVALCKRASEGFGLDSLVRCVLEHDGHYAVRSFDAQFQSDMDTLLRQSMQELQPRLSQGGDGLQRMAVPIQHEGRAIGALLLESEQPLAEVRALVDGFVRIYANYTVLLHESEHDKLTGLYNRRTFERQLERVLKHPGERVPPLRPVMVDRRRPHDPGRDQVWLAILDIDHFKRINDAYGHVYGDEVILLLAQKMRHNFRHGDLLFRFGGEEFVILLNATDADTAHASLERFRAAVAAHAFPQVGRVTVSIGYARVSDHAYPELVIDRADKALYYAKENGRDRVCGYDDLTRQGMLAPSTIGSIDLF